MKVKGALFDYLSSSHCAMLILGIIKWGHTEQSYLFHGNSLNSVYNSHVAGAFDLDRSLKVQAPHPPNFLNVPTNFDFLFLPKLNHSFQTEKFDALRRSFDRKLISPNMSRDTQKHLFDLCMSQKCTFLTGKNSENLR